MGLKEKFKSLFLTNGSSKKSFGSNQAGTVQDAVAKNELNLDYSWIEKNHSLYRQLEDKYYQYFIGVNSLLDLELNAFELDVIESLNYHIKQEDSLADQIPRLPDIVPKLIHLLRTEDFLWKDVADLIAMDPVILVGIIKLANSSAYNLKVTQDELESILVQLGLREVREVIMKVALKPIMLFEGGHFLRHSGTKIWIHAVKSAVACRTLAKTYQVDPFEAYLAGLLNNLGMSIVVKTMNEVKAFTHAPRSVQFKTELLQFAKLLSLKIAVNWDICPPVVKALEEQMNNDDVKDIESSLGKVLFEGTAASMKHILVGEHRWQGNELLDDTDPNSSFNQAYAALDDLKLD